jgi:hypothetical protein
VRALDNPPLGTCATLLLVFLFVAPAEYDRFEPGDMDDAPYLIVVITQVEAQLALAVTDWPSAHHYWVRFKHQLRLQQRIDCVASKARTAIAWRVA